MAHKKPEEGAKEMINNEVLQNAGYYKIDLAKTEVDGTFQCPKCHTTISPDDDTKNVYTILDAKVVNDELVELVISCCTCGRVIKLTGLQPAVEK